MERTYFAMVARLQNGVAEVIHQLCFDTKEEAMKWCRESIGEWLKRGFYCDEQTSRDWVAYLPDRSLHYRVCELGVK